MTTFDSEPAPTTTQNAAAISEGAAGTRAHQRERRRKQLRASRTAMEQSSRGLLVVTAQLIEAACRARDGDSDGTRAHIARAVALLDEHPGPRVTEQPSDRGPRQIPRGGFAAWQSQRLAAHVDANLAGKIVIKDLRRHSTSASVTSVARSSAPSVCRLASGSDTGASSARRPLPGDRHDMAPLKNEPPNSPILAQRSRSS